MKTLIKYIYICFLLIGIYSCGDMDDINSNTDTSAKVPASFLSLRLTLEMTHFNGDKGLFQEAWIVKTMSFTEHTEDYLYNDFKYHGFDSYHNLIDADKMEAEALRDNDISEKMKKSYVALKHFTRAYYFHYNSMCLGDVPCSEAGKALDGILKPAYDSQEKVMATVIRELEQASKLFDEGENFTGDMVYNGDIAKWKKLVNSFMLRVLLNLSKKEIVDGINVKQKFAEYSKKALIESEADNFQRVYSDKAGQRYPYNRLHQNYRKEGVMGKFLVDKLKDLKDNRLFYYTEPADTLIKLKHPENSFDAYSGVDVNAVFSTVQDENNKGMHSRNNNRYIYDPVCEPTAIMSSSEVQFILAEAAVRGWTTPKSAKEHYNNGVTEAMKFTAKYTKSEYRHGIDITDEYITSYLNGTALYNESGSAEQKIEQIIWQKFIASFVQLKLNPYFDYRRTGYPRIPINPKTNLNKDPSKMPMRWMYATQEAEKNSANLENALKAQFGGEDSPTGIMWILK